MTRLGEQNYEYDLLNPAKLLEKYVGKKVRILDKNYYTGEEKFVAATLLSTSGGPVFEIDGAIHLGHPGRIILPEIPDNLIAKPKPSTSSAREHRKTGAGLRGILTKSSGRSS